MRLQRYPEYQISDIEWLGNVPVGWSLERLRFHIKTNPTKSETRGLDPDTVVSFVPMESIREYGGLRLDQTVSLNEGQNG